MTTEEIYYRIEELNRLKLEIANDTIFLNDIDCLAETISKQGANFLLQDSTQTISHALMNDLEILGTAFMKTIKLLQAIENESLNDTEDKRAARRTIAEKYTDYLDSLD